MIRNIFHIATIIFCILWVTKNIAAPAYVYFRYSEQYITLAAKCANAMDESWFAEQQDTPGLRKSTQIHLLDCHDYDVTRKLMLSLGLTEDVLAYLGLIALETHQRTAEELVEQHRFRER